MNASVVLEPPDAAAPSQTIKAELRLREHAPIAQDTLCEALKSPRSLPLIPGAGLIRHQGLR